MKYLRLGASSFILLQIYFNIVFAEESADASCSPYLFGDSAEFPACGSSIIPLSGPEVGGTVVQIGNGGPRECPLRYDVDIFCRFKSGSFSEVFPGLLLRIGDVVECVSPFSGQAINAEVSYTAIPKDCSLEDASWITVGDQFQYFGDRAGVVLSDLQIPSESITLKPSSRLFFSDTPIQIEWSADALALSTFREFIPEGFSEYYSTNVAVEILAYGNTTDSKESPFQIIKSIEMAPHYNTTNLTVDDEIISAFMFSDWGSNGAHAAVVQVRVVAYTELYWNDYYEGDTNENETLERWVLAAKSSKLIGILPKTAKNYLGECPFLFKRDCNFVNEQHPCPPSSVIAQNDNSFTLDDNCPWPSGNSACDPKIDLLDDYFTTCSVQSSYLTNTSMPRLSTEEGMEGGNILLHNAISLDEEILSSYETKTICQQELTGIEDKVDENDGCRCATFHHGAAGCFSNGQNQCCYAAGGALITQYDDGSGRPKCYPSDSTRRETINNFLYDDLPFLYCCHLNDDCESYYNGFPTTPTDEGYINPPIASRSFGDPHLTTFDDIDYDFNGYGEYVALCANDEISVLEELLVYCDPSMERLVPDHKMLSVHYRFASLIEGQKGTVTVGVAIEDPGLNLGASSLVIVPHPIRRLDVYDGANLVLFPQNANRRKLSQQFSGTIITKPASTDKTFFTMTISLPSGLNVRITETGGVMLPAITRPSELTNTVGLLGRPDGDRENDFTDASGDILNVITDQALFTPEQTQRIFNDFGQKWMIKRNSNTARSSTEAASLFRHLEDFDDYYRPDFNPWFEVPPAMPSELPTSTTSEIPSPVPSNAPSATPSDIPSIQPTSSPTLTNPPSIQPTNSPSLTSLPSSVPSNLPSTTPSNLPSIRPTNSPSLTSLPSSVPSNLPSTTPSNLPSVQLTNSPSLTSLPSSVPSNLPSTTPSNLPSVQLTNSPSLSPTNYLSSVPSTTFTNQMNTTSTSNKTGSRQLQNEPEADEVCGVFKDEFIRAACIFDFAVTGDADLVNATTTAAVVEKRTATTLSNNPPEILYSGRNQYLQVALNENSIFKIYAKDIDGDNITAIIERNDGGLFQLTNQISGVFDLHFSGSKKNGYFRAQVIVTDGIVPVIVTGIIQVIPAVPSSMPSYAPIPSPPRTSTPFSTHTNKPSNKPSKKTTKKSTKKEKKKSK